MSKASDSVKVLRRQCLVTVIFHFFGAAATKGEIHTTQKNQHMKIAGIRFLLAKDGGKQNFQGSYPIQAFCLFVSLFMHFVRPVLQMMFPSLCSSIHLTT